MTAIEQAKKNIARAEELAQAVKDGRAVQIYRKNFTPQRWELSVNKLADNFYDSIVDGFEYRIIEPKRRRPWTREEAERHVGWVLVSPDGKRGSLVCIWESTRCLHFASGQNPTLEEACKNNWHVHLPGQPDDLKPCSVEE